MRERILAYIRRYHMVEEGDLVCVGLSGGADSLCLLVILQELSEELGIRLQAVHVNHGLRGEESDQDQAFTERLCREREIPLFVYVRRVGEIARELGVGTEEAGRLVRQQIYLQCMQEHGSTKIALAHHQNDLAETLLFHLARGTSLRGLGAIRPVNGFLIRPLLCVSRGELEQELRSRGMTWRTDSTNLQDQYTRNCIRHHLIPSLVDEVNAQAVAHMAQAAEDLAQADDFLREEARRRMQELVREEKGGICLSEDFCKLPDILQGYLVVECLERLEGSRKDLTRTHVGLVKQLADRQTGKCISLPGGITGVREYGGIFLGRESADRGRGLAAAASPGEKTASLGKGSAAGLSPMEQSEGFGQVKQSGQQPAASGQGTRMGDLPVDFSVLLSEKSLRTGAGVEFPLGQGQLFCRLLNLERMEEAENNQQDQQEYPGKAEPIPEGGKIPQKKYTKWLDYDKMKTGLVVRTRRAGDYLVVNSSGGRKKLKDYLIDQKIPRRERDSIPLLASGSEIYWVAGYRISESCKVDRDTRQVLYIEIRGGSYHE